MPPKDEQVRQPSYNSVEDSLVDMQDPKRQLLDADKTTTRNNDVDLPTNEYVLNVAFFSFIGFVMVQAVFALIANSQAMMADSEAMMVDALTYLFNLLAERIKNRSYSENELQLPVQVREYRRELQRLYLEVVPPFASVLTLISVTILTVRESCQALFGMSSDGGDDEVSVPIMLLFSAANLLLDIVNVTCFARAQSAFGLDVVRTTTSRDALSTQEERQTLLLAAASEPEDEETTKDLVNLNMCSAWTHVCADTLRSTAVLIAAGIAYFVPAVDGAVADSVAAIAVSLIILGSLVPLIHGLFLTILQIRRLSKNPPTQESAIVMQV